MKTGFSIHLINYRQEWNLNRNKTRNIALTRVGDNKSQDPSYWHLLTLIPAWISNHMPFIIWGEITYPFPNFNGCTLKKFRTKYSEIWMVIVFRRQYINAYQLKNTDKKSSAYHSAGSKNNLSLQTSNVMITGLYCWHIELNRCDQRTLKLNQNAILTEATEYSNVVYRLMVLSSFRPGPNVLILICGIIQAAV